MTEFTFHTIESAPEVSNKLLTGVKKQLGFVPNLYSGMAEAPALLEGYLTLSGIFDKSDLSATERQIILLANNRLNGCNYCMAAHTTIAQGANVPDEIIEGLRNGTPLANEKLQALRHFAERVNKTRGWVEQAELDALFAAGYSKQTVLEVILGTGMKVLSNYFNHMAQTPVDQAFESNAWSA